MQFENSFSLLREVIQLAVLAQVWCILSEIDAKKAARCALQGCKDPMDCRLFSEDPSSCDGVSDASAAVLSCSVFICDMLISTVTTVST